LQYITTVEFQDAYEQASRTRAAIRGFINYLRKYETSNVKPTAEPLNREPDNLKRRMKDGTYA